MGEAAPSTATWLQGKRTYSIALLILALASVFLSLGKLDGSQWVTAIGAAAGLYGARRVMMGRQE